MSFLFILRDIHILTFFVSGLTLIQATVFETTRYDNVAVYWGQNSFGAANPTDTANFQQRLSYYCQDDVIDVFPLAFLDVFFGPGDAPSINLANICNPIHNSTFAGTTLPDCSALASDIDTCQSNGKIITLSLGGASGAVGFTDDTQAEAFAQTLWDLFFGGSSSTRPFGDAILDGIDLDIEGGGSVGYAALINKFRSLSSGDSKKYHITAAPQCIFPDSALGAVLNAAEFDAVYVQFYNNPCGLNNFNSAQSWDFGTWDNWARQTSPNKNIKIYLGAPASPSAAGTGYQDIATLSEVAVQMRNSFPSFGGVMLWDASQAYANNRYDKAIKSALAAAGGTGFNYPTCSAPAYSSGTNYPAGSQVSYGGYIWQAKFFASSTPNYDYNGEWSPISACSGSGTSPSLSTPPAKTSTRTSPTKTSTSTTTTPSGSPSSRSGYTVSSHMSRSASPTATSSGCANVVGWVSNIAYTAGNQVVYGQHLWMAKQWSYNDTPGGAAGSWTDEGPCSGSSMSRMKRLPDYKRIKSRISRDV